MRINNWSGLYMWGWTLVSSGIHGYYRKFEVVGLENVPKDKPILIAPNHQNAFIDGALFGYGLTKPVYYLGRSDVFANKFASWMLGGFNILPIYRERDGDDYRQKNEEIFEVFYDNLSKNRAMVIFPEGSHGEFKQIRGPLKKGVFRIAAGAENKYNKELDVHVIPAGIDYEKHSKMGGRLLVQLGEPIRIQEYLSEDKTSQESNFVELVEMLEGRMHDLMIDIRQDEYYALIRNSLFYFEDDLAIKYGQKGKKLKDRFNTEKKAVEELEGKIASHPQLASEIKLCEEEFSAELQKHELRGWLFQKDKHTVWPQLLLMVLLFPIHLYGVVNSYLPYKIPENFANKKFKDPCFQTSIKIIFGAVMFQVFWLVQTILVAVFTDHYIWLFYLLSLPLTAWFSFNYWIYWLKLKGKIRYNGLPKNVKTDLTGKYERIKNFVLQKKAGI